MGFVLLRIYPCSHIYALSMVAFTINGRPGRNNSGLQSLNYFPYSSLQKKLWILGLNHWF